MYELWKFRRVSTMIDTPSSDSDRLSENVKNVELGNSSSPKRQVEEGLCAVHDAVQFASLHAVAGRLVYVV